MIGVGTKYYPLFLPVYLSVCPPMYVCLYVRTYLSISVINISCVLYRNCSCQALGANLSQPSSLWPPSSFPHLLLAVPSAGLLPPAILLLPHSALAVGQKTGLRELRELYSVCPQQSDSYRKWVVSRFPIDSFLSLYVIRCIQLIFTLCPFINRFPPLLWRKVSSM